MQHSHRHSEKRAKEGHPRTRVPPPVEAETEERRQGEFEPDRRDPGAPVQPDEREPIERPASGSHTSPVFPHSPSNREESLGLGGLRPLTVASPGRKTMETKKVHEEGTSARRIFYTGPILAVNYPASRFEKFFTKSQGRHAGDVDPIRRMPELSFECLEEAQPDELACTETTVRRRPYSNVTHLAKPGSPSFSNTARGDWISLTMIVLMWYPDLLLDASGSTQCGDSPCCHPGSESPTRPNPPRP